MHVGFICYQYHQPGGIRIYAKELLKRLSALGHQIVVFTPVPRFHGVPVESQSEFQVCAVPSSDIRLSSLFTFALHLPRAIREIEKRYGRFDVLHSNGVADFFLRKSSFGCARVVTAHHLGVSVITHGGLSVAFHPSQLTKENGPAFFAEGVCLRRADRIIAVSESVRNELTRHYSVDPQRISVVWNGVTFREPIRDDALLRFSRRRWGIDEADKVILFIGSLQERKGLRYLMRSFSLLHSRGDLRLLLVGAGDSRPYAALARRLGVLDKITFTGFVDDSELSAALGLASALVHPSAMEGFGLAVVEAINAGVPVLATRAGSLPEVVREGVDGVLIEYGDEKALAAALVEVAEGRIAKSRAGRESIAERFDWDRTATATAQTYEQAVAGQKL